MHENCTPSHHLHLRQITTSQVLKASAAGRTPYAATEIAKSVVVGVDRKQGGNRQMRKSHDASDQKKVLYRNFFDHMTYWYNFLTLQL